MKRIMFTALAALLLTSPGICPAAPVKDLRKVEIRKPVELNIRGGLPNFYQKLESGKPVKIAYFGGSITAQNGWRPQSLDYLRKLYPNSRIDQIHAAIGGTGSELGAFRLEQDVLRHKPDLVFVEFAVNDSGAAPYRIRQSMEGIVRHIWRTLPLTDICFVYTLTARDIKDLQAGKAKRSTSTMEEIADFYQIPSVNFGPEIAQLEKEGKLVMKTGDKGVTKVSGKELNLDSDIAVTKDGRIPFSNDGVHPYQNTGHVIYTNILKRSLPLIAKAGKPGPHRLGTPMVKDNYEYAAMVAPDHPGIRLSGPVEKLPKTKTPANLFRNKAPGETCLRLSPGAEQEFKFKGSKVNLYNLLGPGCGTLEITVDGKSRKQKLVDPYCTYYRLATAGVAGNVSTDTVHTVKVKVLNEPMDKRAILFERNRAFYDKNEEKYKPLDAYIGAIQIVGEIVK